MRGGGGGTELSRVPSLSKDLASTSDGFSFHLSPSSRCLVHPGRDPRLSLPPRDSCLEDRAGVLRPKVAVVCSRPVFRCILCIIHPKVVRPCWYSCACVRVCVTKWCIQSSCNVSNSNKKSWDERKEDGGERKDKTDGTGRHQISDIRCQIPDARC